MTAKVSAPQCGWENDWCPTDPDLRSDDEATIKVASKKNSSSSKSKNRVFKVKDKNLKVKEPGDYDRGIVAEGAYAQHSVPLSIPLSQFLPAARRRY